MLDWGIKYIEIKRQCWSLLLHWPGGVRYMGCHWDSALVKLHGEADPVTSSHLQGLLQHNSRLLPVRVLAEGADTDVLVQIDVVPEGNCSYSACRCRLDLEGILFERYMRGVNLKLYSTSYPYITCHFLLLIIHDTCKNLKWDHGSF